MKASLVTTVKDARAFIGAFLDSVDQQTRPPDEVVVVDGGSVDGTLDLLRARPGITVLSEPGANISRGRNVGIRAATHDVIAVSDADCVLAPTWLERLLVPIESGAQVAMGFYRPLASGFFQTCAATALPEPHEIREDRFMPSSRSVAFRRDALDAAGGYPEWLDVGEDMYLDHQWRRLGIQMSLARDAIAYWRVRENPATTWRQYFQYARGDAVGGMYPERHALRFAVYAGAAAAVATRSRGITALAAVAGAAYASRRIRRALHLFSRAPDRAAAVVAVPALMVLIDGAKMAGYLAGLVERAIAREAPRTQ